MLGLRDNLRAREPLNWDADVPIHDWEGVRVGGDPPCVRHLYLDNRGLVGIIPPELGRFTGLVVLSLRGSEDPEDLPVSNVLMGSIPPELGRLTALKDLDLRAIFLK